MYGLRRRAGLVTDVGLDKKKWEELSKHDDKLTELGISRIFENF